MNLTEQRTQPRKESSLSEMLRAVFEEGAELCQSCGNTGSCGLRPEMITTILAIGIALSAGCWLMSMATRA